MFRQTSFAVHKNSKRSSSHKRMADLVFHIEIVLTLRSTCKLHVVSRAALFSLHVARYSDGAARPAPGRNRSSIPSSSMKCSCLPNVDRPSDSIASSAVHTGGFSPGRKVAWNVRLTTYRHLMQRS
jgi:hypothetical protein